MKRRDVHRPSAIIPADYEFVAVECVKIHDLGDCLMLQEERARIRAHMARTGGTYSSHAHGGNCAVCGNANAIYTALFYHAATNSYVRAGQDCTEKLWAGHASMFRRITDAVTAAREAKAGKLKAQGVLAELGLSAAWDVSLAVGVSGELQARYEEGTVRDIVEKLIRYGSISERQVSFLRSLLVKIEQRPAIEAKRAAERAAAKPAPVGRHRVEVEVVSLKVHENDFGSRTVMTVKSVADGWLAWGTAPAGHLRGDRLVLAATFTPKDGDPKFAFFKRPRVISFDRPNAEPSFDQRADEVDEMLHALMAAGVDAPTSARLVLAEVGVPS